MEGLKTESEHVLDVTAERMLAAATDPVEVWMDSLAREPGRMLYAVVRDALDLCEYCTCGTADFWAERGRKARTLKPRMKAALEAWDAAQIADYERRQESAQEEERNRTPMCDDCGLECEPDLRLCEDCQRREDRAFRDHGGAA